MVINFTDSKLFLAKLRQTTFTRFARLWTDEYPCPKLFTLLYVKLRIMPSQKFYWWSSLSSYRERFTVSRCGRLETDTTDLDRSGPSRSGRIKLEPNNLERTSIRTRSRPKMGTAPRNTVVQFNHYEGINKWLLKVDFIVMKGANFLTFRNLVNVSFANHNTGDIFWNKVIYAFIVLLVRILETICGKINHCMSPMCRFQSNIGSWNLCNRYGIWMSEGPKNSRSAMSVDKLLKHELDLSWTDPRRVSGPDSAVPSFGPQRRSSLKLLCISKLTHLLNSMPSLLIYSEAGVSRKKWVGC